MVLQGLENQLCITLTNGTQFCPSNDLLDFAYYVPPQSVHVVSKSAEPFLFFSRWIIPI